MRIHIDIDAEFCIKPSCVSILTNSLLQYDIWHLARIAIKLTEILVLNLIIEHW